jgi:WD40 repeat protein
MSYLYLKAPIFSIVTKKGLVLATACGGSSKTGIPNLLVAFRCDKTLPAVLDQVKTSSLDDTDDVSDDCSSVLIKDLSLETGHDIEHLKLAISQNGRLVAALCGNSSCRLYSWNERSILLSSDDIGMNLAKSNTCKSTSTQSLDILFTFMSTSSKDIEASSVAIYSDNIIAIGDITGKIYIWRLIYNKSTKSDGNDTIEVKKMASLVGHKGKVTSLYFDNKGETLVSASDDDTLRVWEVNFLINSSKSDIISSIVLCHVIHGRGNIDLGNRFVQRGRKGSSLRWKFRGVSMLPDGCSLFALETSDIGGAVLVKWRTTSIKDKAILKNDVTTIAPIEYVSLDGKISTTIENDTRNKLEPTRRWIFSIWTVASSTPASALASNSTFDRLVVGSNDGSVRLFDSNVLGSPLWVRKDVHQMSVTCVAFVENGDKKVDDIYIVTGSADAQLVLLPITAPPQTLNPRLVAFLLLLLTLTFALTSFYKHVDKNDIETEL